MLWTIRELKLRSWREHNREKRNPLDWTNGKCIQFTTKNYGGCYLNNVLSYICKAVPLSSPCTACPMMEMSCLCQMDTYWCVPLELGMLDFTALFY